MSKIEMLRVLINQRLTAAAEEIFSVFGRTIAEYEEEISRSKLEIDRQRRLLELSRKPHVSLPVFETAISEQQQWSSSLGQNTEEPPCIKEEEEEEEEEEDEEEADDVWTDQQDKRSEQNNVGFVLFQSSAGRKQQDGSLRPSFVPNQGQEDSELEPQPGPSVQQTCSDLSENEPGACDVTMGNSQFDCEELDVPVLEGVDSYVCTICGRAFAQRSQWTRHVQVHRKTVSKADKSFKCDICGKRLTRFDGYQKHLRVHTGEKPYCCSMCGRRFSDRSNFKRHIRKHSGLK